MFLFHISGPGKTYSLRSGRVPIGHSEQEASSNTVQPQIITQGVEAPTDEVTHVTATTNLSEHVEIGDQPPTNINVDATIENLGETPGRGTARKILGRALETKLLDDVFADLTITRLSPPPLVPLCRLMTNEAIRTTTASLDGLKESLENNGYCSRGSPPFFVSLRRPGGTEYLRITNMDRTLWGPVWTKISDDFDAALPEEWEDLRGRKFLVWDGNHRVKAWLSMIRECNISFH